MADKLELLPCPMCGCAATFVKHSAGMPNTQAFDKWDSVACKHCRTTVGVSDRRFRCREDAAAAWNLRVPAAPPPAGAQQAVADVIDAFEAEWNGFHLDHGDVIGWIEKMRAAATPSPEAAPSAKEGEALTALRAHHDWSLRNLPEYSEHGDERVIYRATVIAIKGLTPAGGDRG